MEYEMGNETFKEHCRKIVNQKIENLEKQLKNMPFNEEHKFVVSSSTAVIKMVIYDIKLSWQLH